MSKLGVPLLLIMIDDVDIRCCHPVTGPEDEDVWQMPGRRRITSTALDVRWLSQECLIRPPPEQESHSFGKGRSPCVLDRRSRRCATLCLTAHQPYGATTTSPSRGRWSKRLERVSYLHNGFYILIRAPTLPVSTCCFLIPFIHTVPALKISFPEALPRSRGLAEFQDNGHINVL